MNASNPYPRSAAVLLWLFGDLSDDRQHRAMWYVMIGGGVVAGALVALLLPVWARLLAVGVLGAGVVWLIRVAVAYGAELPWQDDDE
jgi:hypothetical protein